MGCLKMLGVTAFPAQHKTFFSQLLPSCLLQHGGIVLLSLLLLDTNFYSNCLFFSCKFFKITSDDKNYSLYITVYISDIKEG